MAKSTRRLIRDLKRAEPKTPIAKAYGGEMYLPNHSGITKHREFVNAHMDTLQFNLNYADGQAEGRLQWNNVDGTLEVGMPGGEVNLQIGQEELIRAKNTSGSTISNGSPVRISGATGTRLEIGLSDADDAATAGSVGLTTEDILNNALGYVTTRGTVRDFDTTGGGEAWSEGDRIYVSDTAGELTNIVPTGTSRIIFIGSVTRAHATEGSILVNPINTPFFDELSGNDQTATSAELDTLTNDSMVDDLHRHSELSASDGAPNPALSVDDTGQVGIGETTPLGKLHVKSADSGVAAPIAIADELILENNDDCGLSILTPNTVTGYILFGDPENSVAGGILYGHTNDEMQFAVNGATKVTIDSGGNVGIGTTSPDNVLHIKDAGTDHQLLLERADGSRPNKWDFFVSGTTAGEASLFIEPEGKEGDVIFRDFGNTETMRIDNTNNRVGIGTAAPVTELHITDAALAGAGTNAADQLTIENDGSANINLVSATDNSNTLIFSDTTRARGFIRYEHATDQLVTQVNGAIRQTIDSAGLMTFSNGAGLPHGSMYNHDVATTVTIAGIGTWVRVPSGFTAGQTTNTTFQNAREIKVLTAGHYKIDWSLSINMVAGANQQIEGGIMKNGSITSEGTAHRTIATGTDIGSMSGTAILSLAANDVISLAVVNETSTNNVSVKHGSMSILHVGS